MNGGHEIPFSVPIRYGFDLLRTGWDLMKAYTFMYNFNSQYN